MTFPDLRSIIEKKFPEAILGEDLQATPCALLINPQYLHPLCAFLHEHKKTYFDQLSCLTGLDNGLEAGTMEVIYNLYSIPFDLHLMLKVALDRSKPEIQTVSDIWRTADWHERETYDLLGIVFLDHPDLRRILLPKDWVGHPLRKDYKEQEEYHGIRVVYDRNDEGNDRSEM